MKKFIVLITVLIGFASLAKAQSITKQDTKKATNEIKVTIDKIDKAIEETDWSQIEKVVEKTGTTIEKNANEVLAVLEKIEFDKLIESMDEMVIEFEKQINVKDLQEKIEEVGVKIDKTFSGNKTVNIEIK